MPDDSATGLVAELESLIQPLQPTDLMSEAGRKIVLRDFVEMLSREAGSILGEDPEEVHKMRVATRRMRSAFRLFEPYYRGKVIRPLTDGLRRTARALGAVRDLDVLLEDLTQIRTVSGVPEAAEPAGDDGESAADDGLQAIHDHINAKRDKARAKLVKYFQSKAYAEFVASMYDFLTVEGAGALGIDAASHDPYQVRHIVPPILQEHLAVVRAYDTVIPTAKPAADSEPQPLPEITVLHQLRIEFKRLRYALSFFGDVLGSPGAAFVDEIKTMQDYLGRLNDLHVFADHLDDYIADGLSAESVQAYAESLAAERAELEAGFPAIWHQFMRRRVQSKFQDALLVLR
jgi:CHAD domain-containing protein